jgi:predicted transcriptional regulator
MPAYLAKYDLGTFPTVNANADVVSRYYLLQVPKTVLVDANGKVAKVWRGVVTASAVLQGWTSIAKQ